MTPIASDGCPSASDAGIGDVWQHLMSRTRPPNADGERGERGEQGSSVVAVRKGSTIIAGMAGLRRRGLDLVSFSTGDEGPSQTERVLFVALHQTRKLHASFDFEAQVRGSQVVA